MIEEQSVVCLERLDHSVTTCLRSGSVTLDGNRPTRSLSHRRRTVFFNYEIDFYGTGETP